MVNQVKENVQRWLKEVIVEHKFCPFAKDPFSKGQIFFEVCQNDAQSFYNEWIILLEKLRSNNHIATALFIAPNLDENYGQYLDKLEALTIHIEQEYAEFTIAPFHPNFVFDNSDVDDAENWIHRAPHAIFHVLSIEQLDQIVAQGADIDRILKRNKEEAIHLGAKYFQQFLH